MDKKLYVGGLSYDTSEATLKEMFSGAGTVESASIIMDRMTNRSKGFGFVEMSSEAEAKKAIELFDGKELEGRSLTVNIARPKEDRPQGGGFNQGNSGRPGFGGGNNHRRRNSW
jgi:RNA recognition motif-containing protein